MQRNYLRYWRDQNGMTAKQVADAIGRHIQTVQRWEHGHTDMGPDDEKAVQDLFGISRGQLILGPAFGAASLTEPHHFAEDAVAYDPGNVPGLKPKLADTEFLCEVKTNAVSGSRDRLQKGDLAVFDTGAKAIARLQSGDLPDGSVVMAQAYDDATGTAETILRQWTGPWPGLLYTNKPGANQILTLALRDDVRIKGVLKRSMRSHGGAGLAVRAPDKPA